MSGVTDRPEAAERFAQAPDTLEAKLERLQAMRARMTSAQGQELVQEAIEELERTLEAMTRR